MGKDRLERWKIVAQCPDYQVSSLGRVRRVAGKRGTHAGKILQSAPDEGGYYRIRLCDAAGKRPNLGLSRLVAKAFIPNPLNLPEVNHKKGAQKWNNSVANLEWRSTLGNRQHAARTGLTRGVGITFCKRLRKWKARYNPAPNTRIYLGLFSTRKSALKARQIAVNNMTEVQ